MSLFRLLCWFWFCFFPRILKNNKHVNSMDCTFITTLSLPLPHAKPNWTIKQITLSFQSCFTVTLQSKHRRQHECTNLALWRGDDVFRSSNSSVGSVSSNGFMSPTTTVPCRRLRSLASFFAACIVSTPAMQMTLVMGLECDIAAHLHRIASCVAPCPSKNSDDYFHVTRFCKLAHFTSITFTLWRNKTYYELFS